MLKRLSFLKIGNSRPLFHLVSLLLSNFYATQFVNFSGIQTRIVGVEGKRGDHLTTTSTLLEQIFRRELVVADWLVGWLLLTNLLLFISDLP